MTISYKNSVESINWDDVASLFRAVNWGDRNPKEIELAFSKSSSVRFAYDNDKLVGFGRTVDDGVYYAMIADLVIDPGYQGYKIGSHILKELQESMKNYQFLTLTSATGKEDFYIKQKWQRQSSAFIWPTNEKQRRDHAKDS